MMTTQELKEQFEKLMRFKGFSDRLDYDDEYNDQEVETAWELYQAGYQLGDRRGIWVSEHD